MKNKPASKWLKSVLLKRKWKCNGEMDGPNWYHKGFGLTDMWPAHAWDVEQEVDRRIKETV